MGRFLVRAFKVFCVAVLLLLTGVVLIIEHPNWILRPGWVTHFLDKSGLHWTGLEMESRTLRFLEPVIRVRWNQLALHSEVLDVQATKGEISVAISFRHFPPILTAVGPVELNASLFALHPSEKASSSSPGSTPSSGLPSWLKIETIALGRILINVDRWVVPGDSGAVRLFHEENSARWKISGIEQEHSVSLSLLAMNPRQEVEGPWAIQLDAGARGLSDVLREVHLEHCKIVVTKEDLQLNCPLVAQLHPPQIPRMGKIKLKERLPLMLISHLQSKDLFDMKREVRGEVALKLLPIDALTNYKNFLRAWGEVRASGSAIPDQPPSKWKVESTLDLELQVRKFQRLVQILDPTDYAVPAPFHALEGVIDLSVRGKIDMHRAQAPIQLLTRLSSPNQDLDLDVASTATIHQFQPSLKSALTGTVLLTKVRIPLPRMTYQKFPAVLPDSRIARARQGQKAGRAPTSESSSLDYRFRIKTERQPVQILSNLTKAPIPVHVDLALDSDSPVQGKIHIDSFPLDLFRRNAKVERADLDLIGKAKRISAVVRVDYTDYTIHIIVSGTVDEPIVKFESEPALSDQDVISVLLFGRTSQDLDQGQNQSVGSVSSAAASRSLDLASLYLLASTPVESVSYDPGSGALSARFRLATGTTLEVSEAQSELASIGLRKRIGSHWAVTTRYGNPADPNDKSVSTLLEWSHRY